MLSTGISSTDSNSNTIPTTSLPLASTDLSEVIAIANSLVEGVERGSFEEIRGAAQSLLSSGQVLAAEAFILNKHSNPLDITGRLIGALDSTAFAFERDLRYMTARILRLFAELTLLRKLKTGDPIRSDWQQDYLNKLNTLISHSKAEGLPGLKFELQCAHEAIRRWTTIDFQGRYGERLVEFFTDSAEGVLDGGLGGVKHGLQLIKDLRKERAASWYHEVLILGVEGARCAANLERFRGIQQEIKTAYDRLDSKDDKKLLLCAADLLADLAWRSRIPEIREGALNGVRGGTPDGSDNIPGLVDIASIQHRSSSGIKNLKSRKLWRVRYHACCHLSALRNHHVPEIAERAGEALSNRDTLENHEKAKALLSALANEPPCEAYQSFFYTASPKLYNVDESAELKLQEANLIRRELELGLKWDSLQEREKALAQATTELHDQKQKLADVQRERAEVSAKKHAISFSLSQVQTEKQELSRLRATLEEGQEAFLVEVRTQVENLQNAQRDHLEVAIAQQNRAQELDQKDEALRQLQTEIQDRDAQLADIQAERLKVQEEQRLHRLLVKEAQAQASYLEKLSRSIQEDRKSLVQEIREAFAPAHSAVGPDVLPPLALGTYIPREDLQRAIEERLLNQESSPRVLTACQGMGGVGKTTLALYAIHSDSARQHYQGHRYWFHDSDDRERLQAQFHQLAVKLKLIHSKAIHKKAVSSVLVYFNSLDKPYFIVFDNAGTPNSLKRYLPERGGNILITTRNFSWPDRLEVDVLDPNQSVALISKFLGSARDASELAETMGHHPLGLIQACAYIQADPYLSVAEFLEFLKAHSGTILESHPELRGKPIPVSVAALWSVTLDKLDAEASALLNQLACLAPDKIPIPLAVHMGTEKACKTLLKYALIQKRDDDTLSIHRLLQMVVRLRDSDHTATLQKAFKALAATYIHEPPHHAERVVNWRLLPHGGTLLSAYDSLTSPSKELQKTVTPSLDTIGGILLDLGDAACAKERFERALAIEERVHGPDHPSVAIRLNNLGRALHALGDAVGAKKRFERALAIDQDAYGPDHPILAIRLNNLGLVRYAVGDAAGAKKRFERALAIDQNAYGPEHSNVAGGLSNLGIALHALGDASGARKRFEQALAIHEQVYGPKHPSVASCLNNLGTALHTLGDPSGARDQYERALAIDEQVYGPKHPNVATHLSNLGLALRALGDPAGAQERYERALAIDEQVYGPEHPKVATHLGNLGSALRLLGDPRGAQVRYERALAIVKKVHGSKHPRIAELQSGLGRALLDLGDAAGARERFERALAIDEQVYGPEHPNVANRLNNIGRALLALGYPSQARDRFERALAIVEKVYGSEHPKIATYVSNLGVALQALGDSSGAQDRVERALAIDQKVYGPEHPNVATRLSNLGLILQDLVSPLEAKKRYKQALAIDKKVYGPKHPNVASSFSNLGSALRALGKPSKAQEKYERALAIDEEVYGPKHPKVATDLSNLGLVQRDRDQIADAKRQLERALAIDEEVYGPMHPKVATDLSNLGLAQRDCGKAADAKKQFERALAIAEEVYGSEDPKVATSLNYLGLALCDLGDARGAKKHFERALAIDEEVYGPMHPKIATDLSNLGLVQRILGEYEGAKKRHERALGIEETAYGLEDPKVAIRLNKLGRALDALGDAEGARKRFEWAYAIAEKHASMGPSHPDTKKFKNNLDQATESSRAIGVNREDHRYNSQGSLETLPLVPLDGSRRSAPSSGEKSYTLVYEKSHETKRLLSSDDSDDSDDYAPWDPSLSKQESHRPEVEGFPEQEPLLSHGSSRRDARRLEEECSWCRCTIV